MVNMAMRQWIKEYYYLDFARDQVLESALRSFIESLRERQLTDDAVGHRSPLDTASRPSSSYIVTGVLITPAINEGCTRSLRISHSMYCIVPTTCV